VSAILFSVLLAAAAGRPAPVSEVVVPGKVTVYENAAAGLDAKPTKPNGTDVICWDEKPAGSHIVKRICGTRAEVERMQDMSKQMVTERPRSDGGGGMKSN